MTFDKSKLGGECIQTADNLEKKENVCKARVNCQFSTLVCANDSCKNKIDEMECEEMYEKVENNLKIKCGC